MKSKLSRQMLVHIGPGPIPAREAVRKLTSPGSEGRPGRTGPSHTGWVPRAKLGPADTLGVH